MGDGETWYYFYDPDGNPVWEYKPGVGWETFNFYFNGKHLAVNNTTEGLRWRHQDHLGSLRVKTDSTGAVKCRYWYYPYGELWSSTCPEKDARRFTDKERDPESGLDYFGARYYASPHGRFTSPDWSATPLALAYADLADPQTLNLYPYVRNNPLRMADIDGHGWFGDFFSGVADTTYRPIVQVLSRPPGETAAALGAAAAHPIDTASAIVGSAVSTGKAALSGDARAIGQVTGTVVSTIALAGAGKAVSALVKGAEVGEAAEAVAEAGGLARNAASAPNLAKQLASEEGVAELLNGGGKTIAGAGVEREIDDVARLVSQYGGERGDWAKITSTAPGHLQTHAYRNVVSGEVVELKSVVQ